MSKYIDKDKVLEYIIFQVVGKEITCGELKRAIESLPTIEVSDKADRPFEYLEGYEDGRKSVEVSEDCISREQTIEAIDEVDWYHVNSVGELVSGSTSNGEAWYRAEDVYKAIELVEPSVVPTERTGEWKHTMTYYPYCSECEWMPEEDEMTHGRYNYCPNCGAKMEG